MWEGLQPLNILIIRDWQSENALYELKLTNRQIALVDINTNTPLKLP